jgi:hypothetical protein
MTVNMQPQDSSEKSTESMLISQTLINSGHKTIEDSLESFRTLNEPAAIYDDIQVYTQFFTIKYLIKNPAFKEFNLFVKHNSADLFESMLAYFGKKLDSINFETCHIESNRMKGNNNNNNNNNTDDDLIKDEETTDNTIARLDQRRFSIFYNLLVIINEIVFRSIEANLHLSKHFGMVRALAAFLRAEFVLKCSHSNKSCLTLLIVKNLSLLSRWSDEVRHEWKELNLVRVLLDTVKLVIQSSAGPSSLAQNENSTEQHEVCMHKGI